MLEIKLLKKGWMEQSGSSLLKMMQNFDMPNLDLIVRESIQNSLDAALPNNNEAVKVRIRYDDFDNERLSNELASIGKKLNKIHIKNGYKALMISDYNTTGLTGNLNGIFNKEDKNQHLGKLVFQVMKPQDREGAGGSWGIGKTVYYRIGLGLVFYYSRIKLHNGMYQDRLAGALVENENDKNGLLSDYGVNNLGAAFFGETYKDGYMDFRAISDSDRIKDFLSIFNFKPYSNDETGTTIIIPFIDEEKLLLSNINDISQKAWWHNSVTDYLKVSTLRWYFPRLSPKYSYGPKLVADVNGDVVFSDKYTHIFALMQQLYNAAFSNEYPEWITKKEIIRQKQLDNKVIGWFMYGVLTKEDISYDSNLNIIDHFFGLQNDDEQPNRPIIGYCRKPGMVMSYSQIKSVSCDKDSFIVGLFVLNSRNAISSPIRLNLDEYLRRSEKSDHLYWTDYEIKSGLGKIGIVNQTTSQIENILVNTFGEKQTISGQGESNTILSHVMGRKYLPTEFFGNSLARTKKSNGISGRSGKKTTNLNQRMKKSSSNNVVILNSQEFDDYGGIILEYSFVIDSQIKKATLFSHINTTNKPCNHEKWEDSGQKYPISIDKVALLPRKYNHFIVNDPIMFLDQQTLQYKGISLRYLTTKLGVRYGMEMTFPKDFTPIEIDLKLTISTNDKLLQLSFDVDFEE